MDCIVISDFKNERFQRVFKMYFQEFGINVRDWDGLFEEMNSEEKIEALLCLEQDGEVIGFIQYQFIQLAHSFFEEKLGFIREFWIDNEHREKGYGTSLLKKTEDYFKEKGIHKTILTSDTEEEFFVKRGYKKDESINAKNNDNVYIKELF